jgi:hypothetical protein
MRFIYIDCIYLYTKVLTICVLAAQVTDILHSVPVPNFLWCLFGTHLSTQLLKPF